MDIVPQLIVNSSIAGATYALVALGFNVIYGATKFFNMAHGVIAAVGAYTVFFFTKMWTSDDLFFSSMFGPSDLPAIIVGVFFAGAVGYFLDKIIYMPLRKRKASGMVLMVASLGAFTALQAIIAIFFTSQFQTLTGNAAGERIFELFGAVITQTQGIIVISGFVIMGMLVWLMNKTMFGKAVRAISDDEEVARIVGIDTNKVIGKVFFLGSAIAGLAGILIGFDTGIEPTMGMNLLLKGIVGSVIGGVGNIYGGVAGSFVLGFAENFGIWKISGEWKDAIAFALLIIFLLFRPQGIMKK